MKRLLLAVFALLVLCSSAFAVPQKTYVSDLVVKGGPWVDVRAFKNLSTAKVYAEAANKRLLIPSPVSCNALTINCDLEVAKGGSITRNGTLTVNGGFSAGYGQVFFGTGSIIWAGKVKPLVAEWFDLTQDLTATVSSYISAMSAANLPVSIPTGMLHTVGLIADGTKIARKAQGAKLPNLKADLAANPNLGIHFIGDSVTNGAMGSVWTAGDARHSLGYATIFGYGVHRSTDAADATVLTESTGASTTQGPLGALVDYPGVFDSAGIAGSANCYVKYVTGSGNYLVFSLPATGKASLFMPILSPTPGVVSVQVNINGTGWFTPSAADGVSIDGFSNPGSLDFSALQYQIKELVVHYPAGPNVQMRLSNSSGTGAKVAYLPNIERRGNVLISTPDQTSISKNSYGKYNAGKLVALAKSQFNSVTVSYVSGPTQPDTDVYLVTNAGTIVRPSSISGLAVLDTGMHSTNPDTISATSTSVVKYNSFCLFMSDKSSLYSHGIIGVIFNQTGGNISVQDVAFHGLVNNEGVSGITVGGYAAQYPSRIAPYVNPGDYVFINLGINDWNALPPTSRQSLKAGYRTLINSVLNQYAFPVMITPDPVQFSLVTATHSDNKSLQYADVIDCVHEVADEFGLPIVDMYAQLAKVPNLFTFYADDLHPTDAGHSMIGSTLLRLFGASSD